MNAKTTIDAGICGFPTKVNAESNDGQNKITSACEKIRAYAENLEKAGAIDAYQEISPENNSQILEIARITLKGCCSGCVVPIGVFKTMQVACGLALPKDIEIKISKEE
ncbi:MAG: hypothetical protein UU48_C0023G0009 [Candidatus Uhrbacteria bacterium GW2011_GWF2_41_16]|uniref:Uncharacterized protein n=1 Tax=Candidatus Uhrbacteria bacterium GW2011_GWF2_41_16 TaxID=1618997 RepID=A0A0G0V743_9BACT|nr:MAG: hypothetical protein UU48_C0023G0009 [Candidatus Uhrbacteria bacterium GW2011_GWF2_41_16]